MTTVTEAPASTTAEGPTSHTQNQFDALADKVEQVLNRSTERSGTHGYTRAEQLEALHRLREPFKSEEIRYRPQPWCKACSSTQGWPKVCQRHHEITCQRCKSKITEAHICLKFVGHAEATNRLLNTDPFWDWEPFALDQVGLPQYDQFNGMWIRMTVCGMTRIGYGDAAGKSGANAVKEIIGDAIRNAGIRFGMALDLWTSSDLQIIESGGTGVEGEESPAAPQAQSGTPTPSAPRPDSGDHVARLVGQAQACYANAIALSQVLADAEKHNVADEECDGPDGRTTLRVLLNDRITFLNQARAAGHNTERGAA